MNKIFKLKKEVMRLLEENMGVKKIHWREKAFLPMMQNLKEKSDEIKYIKTKQKLLHV